MKGFLSIVHEALGWDPSTTKIRKVTKLASFHTNRIEVKAG